MKINLKLMLLLASMVTPCSIYAQSNEVNSQEIYSELRTQMARACPMVWEDLGADMNTESLTGDVWSGNSADQAQFVSLLQEIIPNSSPEDRATMSTDIATVATECASHRVALLDALISKTPRDVLLAMDAVNKGLNKTVEYLDGGWSVGDVRITGRLEAQDGWVFLIGQTVGNTPSAQLNTDDYNELFELAKNWAPNTGNEDWAAGHIVTLPDMRGRALVAADNMGGASANVVAEANADKIGGTFGVQSAPLTLSQLPTHNHTMNTKGAHTHTAGYNGNHQHNLKQGLYNPGNYGPGTYSNRWPTGGLRPSSDGGNSATLTTSVLSAGNHNHSLSTTGNHSHTIANKGSSATVKRLPPSIVFNVEMKY